MPSAPIAPVSPNRNISPLIRGARWVALISGIVYGHQRLQYLREKERVILEREDIIRKKNREILAQRKSVAYNKEMKDLAKALNHTPSEHAMAVTHTPAEH